MSRRFIEIDEHLDSFIVEMLQVRTLSEDLEIISDHFAFSCHASDRAVGLVGTRDSVLALHSSLPITQTA